ncbi:ParB N-terminal domain-containing protein [Paenirhodobacter sp. CAU 1674]|uniref:ParB N-terminal domain-containing protein n=1 Tax=Paenirhodobacter sp. CAU 1674 TaxID=3032596 RepID=UPI0023DB9564|nr:ParB N-terminal domain-containing protein [Paenirhodobacter sp. CAU 1674]MDF2141216.1 ParB N-terminal domain-containing protein [Paenirhodobacter sp. CAU 1674]
MIDVPKNRARGFDAAAAEALAAIIAEQGLMHPIRVRPNGERFMLIAGLHRLEAHRINGAETIAATLSEASNDDEARLEEVMENLGRGELIALDRCQHLYELKVVYERMHPEAKHGGDRSKSQSLALGSERPEIFGFAKATAAKIGLSQSAIKAAVKIWTDLTPASRLRLIGTNLARKQTELKALSEQKPAMQAKILELIESEEHPAVQNVAQAIAHLEGTLPVTAVERMVRTIRTGLKELPDASFDLLVAENEERILASLKRTGRI